MATEQNCIFLCRPKPLNPERGQSLLGDIQRLGLTAQNLHLTEHRLLAGSIDKAPEQALLFSSATGVDALRELEKQKRAPFLNRNLPVLAVGAQTADAVKQLGFKRVHTGKAGMVALLNTGLPWLKHQLEQQAGFPLNEPIHLSYLAPKHPKYDLLERTFVQLLDSEVRPLFSTLEIVFTPLYVTERTSALWQTAAEQLSIENNLSKIKYLSFFSLANAVNFSTFLGSKGAISHQISQSYDGTQSFRFAETKALCFSKAIADALPSELFQSVHVCEKPRRTDFLTLLRTLESYAHSSKL